MKHNVKFVANITGRLFGGLRSEAVSPTEAEQAQICVCGTGQETAQPGDVLTCCGLCDQPIHHRPTAPKQPLKVCGSCAHALVDPLLQAENRKGVV